jgi:hypothetical protein
MARAATKITARIALAIDVAEARGLSIAGVEIAPDDTIRIVVGEGVSSVSGTLAERCEEHAQAARLARRRG